MQGVRSVLKNSILYKRYFEGSIFQRFYRYLFELPYRLNFWLKKNRDLLSTLPNFQLFKTHLEVHKILTAQNKEWKKYVYGWGYFYQGYKKLKITGVRPTEVRMQNYGFIPYLKPHMKVLDIGTNAGFVAMELAPFVKEVDAIEWNPYLIKIAKVFGEYLGFKNINFYASDFNTFQANGKYDVILSFANHHTTDGGIRPELRQFFDDLGDRLNLNGYIFFESHPQDLNEEFKNFMTTLSDMFETVEFKTVSDSKLGGVRLFYILKKKYENTNR